MSVEIGAVAAEFGRAIVQAMASDGWATLRPRLSRVLKRGRADHLVAALSPDAAALGAGKLPAEVAAGRWTGRIEGLLHQHPELLDELADVLADTRAEGTPREARAGAPVMIQQATGSRSQAATAGRDLVNSNNRKRISFGGIGIVAAVALVLLLTGGVVINNIVSPASGSAIDADTLCEDYLQKPQWEREQAIRRIAVELEAPVAAGAAFAVQSVDYSCGNRLKTPVGEVITQMTY